VSIYKEENRPVSEQQTRYTLKEIIDRRTFIRRASLGTMGALVIGPRVLLAATQPNFVFILSDDQGWDGLSIEMHDAIPASKSDFYQTPNLEKLAHQGMRFSTAYAPASVCSPTRCSLQTGKSPAQNHWTKASPIATAEDGFKLIPPQHGKDLSTNEITIAEILQQVGYATAHYGKWHLGGGGPGSHGYDEHDGDTNNQDAIRFVDPNPVDIFGMSNRANAFMEKYTKAGKPFFIQLSYHALHHAENALAITLQKYESLPKGKIHKNVQLAAITENLDTGVGMLMDQIDKLGIGENTYVIYMSDNGAGGNRGVLRGGKGSLWEGGIRIPLIIRGPGIQPKTFCHERVVGYDFFPTLCELAGVTKSLPEGIEGGSIASLLLGDHTPVKRSYEELVFHFPHYQSDDGPHSALMLGNLKLIKFYENNTVQLFDLSKDIGEQNDLTNSLPTEAAQLHERLQHYLTSVNAQLPVPNPNYVDNNIQTGSSNAETKSTDFNGDGKRDFNDFLSFARAYGSNQPVFDLDNSGKVDFADFLRFTQDFGK
jgi:arylsulfatase A